VIVPGHGGRRRFGSFKRGRAAGCGGFL